MVSEFREVRGTSDLLGADLDKFLFVESVASNLASRYSFSNIRTPILEYASLFERGLGDDSDIINKEMYVFESRGGERLTLRPEFTSSIARVVASRKVDVPAKLFCHGPAFRYERPQKGRRRQFHQINFEIFGVGSVYADAEIICLAREVIGGIGINLNDVVLHINSLGDSESIAAYRDCLVSFLSSYAGDLSENSQKRLKINPLRILDSKEEKDILILKEAPNISVCWSNEARRRFDSLLNLLDKLSVSYLVDYKLVRGLDYYTSVVFEFVTSMLGAQGTIIAGGRYDTLVQSMCGLNIPSVGFAGGIERLSELSVIKDISLPRISIISLVLSSDDFAFIIACELRSKGFLVEMEYVGNAKNKMKKAGNKSVIALIIGEQEVEGNFVSMKDLITGEQTKVNIDDLAVILSEKIKSNTRP